jgi:hypothetical protein
MLPGRTPRDDGDRDIHDNPANRKPRAIFEGRAPMKAAKARPLKQQQPKPKPRGSKRGPREPVAATVFKHATREAWLEAAIAEMAEWFEQIDAPLPPRLRVSTGFPSAWSRKNLNENRFIGQCWSQKAADDGVSQIFVSPIVGDAVRALDVLAHELVHAAVGTEAGHGKVFKRAARAVGLDGPMKATTAGPVLRARLDALVEQRLGPYPHAALRPTVIKRQTTRMRLVQCVECEYKLRGSLATLQRGLPTCGVCGERMTPAVPLDIEDASHANTAA